ncbi:MAG: zf-HC2 domain-containing protein [Bacillota bacterium]|nr:zf-HC2 domain-containing protein [Bacillota bacterium]
MKCEVIQDLLQLYVDDLCSGDSRGLIEEHLESCSECREFLNSLKERDTLFQEAEVEVDGVVERKLLGNIKKRLLFMELMCLSMGAFGGLYTTLFVDQFKLVLIYPLIGCIGYFVIRRFWVTPAVIFGVSLFGCIIMGSIDSSIMLSLSSSFLTVIGCIIGYLLIKIFKGDRE